MQRPGMIGLFPDDLVIKLLGGTHATSAMVCEASLKSVANRTVGHPAAPPASRERPAVDAARRCSVQLNAARYSRKPTFASRRKSSFWDAANWPSRECRNQ